MKCLNQDMEQQYRHEEKCLLNHVVGVNSELDMMVPVALQGQTSSQRISAICRFALKDLGLMKDILGFESLLTTTGLHLTQSKYTIDLLTRTNMHSAKPIPTPMSVALKLYAASGLTFSDPTLYRSTIGVFQYLTYTRLDIAFAVNKLNQYLQQPTELHWTACKRVLRYLKGTIHHGLHFTPASSLHLQSVVARSSIEVEYCVLAHASTKVAWLRSIFSELGISLVNTPVIWCDNQGVSVLAANPVFHSRMNHIEVDVHYVREQVLDKKLVVSYVHSVEQVANLFTKPLSIPSHVLFIFLQQDTEYWDAPEKPLRRWLCSYARVGRMVVERMELASWKEKWVNPDS
uniref:Retrovirus-related Pol polyprotein from transposon RE2 n=1 Tax=Vitis vinifera TaxID=29760 RepID=A5BY10_VITVI|nr:hypothetical protein VITISV_004174 [Vitis vinifera]